MNPAEIFALITILAVTPFFIGGVIGWILAERRIKKIKHLEFYFPERRKRK